MAKIGRLIGGAGTGKTTELLRMVDGVIAEGVGPSSIGFVSFTRAARSEAASRAAKQFGMEQFELEQQGWFKTLHSICYRQLSVSDELLADDKDSKEWFNENFGEDGGVQRTDGFIESAKWTETSQILHMWSIARNKLVSFEDVWSVARRTAQDVPMLSDCTAIVDQYEHLKKRDGRLDFEDLLGLFAGVGFSSNGPEEITPDGDIPGVPVWFFDEQQDTSPLLDKVCRRLASGSNVKWVYLAGDPFQSIYGFSGANGQLFRKWPADKEKIMSQSWRCGKEILDLAEACLVNCDDYFSRGIAPAGHSSNVVVRDWIDFEEIDPDQSWLIIARTNKLAREISHALDESGIPWESTKSQASWLSKSKRLACCALHNLASDFPIDYQEWKYILREIPVKGLLERGTKTQWLDRNKVPDEKLSKLQGIGNWGATEKLKQIIQSEWEELVEGGALFRQSVDRHGVNASLNTNIQVGTIHSVKGGEADNVMLWSASVEPCRRSEEMPEGLDEERRIAYVAITRARRQLVILDRQSRHRMPIPGL